MSTRRSALEQAHALSVTTRKRNRSLPIEDPEQVLERIIDYVNTHSYRDSYTYLHHPVTAAAPHTKSESGAGYYVGALFFLPIFVISVPLLALGVLTTLASPATDEPRNQPHRRRLLDELQTLKSRVRAELNIDRTRANEVRARVATEPASSWPVVGSPAVSKAWRSIYLVEAGVAQRRRNGWHLTGLGKLHVGEHEVSFFGSDGETGVVPAARMHELQVLHNSVLLVGIEGSRKAGPAFFLRSGAYEALAHLEAVRERAIEWESAEAAERDDEGMVAKLRQRSKDAAEKVMEVSAGATAPVAKSVGKLVERVSRRKKS